MALFKQIREAANRSPYAIGMAVAKKKAGITAKHAEGLPKSVITKGHEIAKKIKANESYDTILAELEVELTLESMTAEEIQNFIESAEFEQLDEISKATLGSYVKKASTSLASNAMKAGDRTDKKSGSSFRKAVNRMSGIQIAANKLTKEEVEELDELDKKTLGSYVNKSHDQLMKHTASVNMKYGRGDKDATAYALDKDALRKTANRTQGMKTAISKLTKEDMDLNEAEMTSAQIMKKIKDGTHEAMTDIKPGKHVELRHTGTGVKKMVYVKPASVK